MSTWTLAFQIVNFLVLAVLLERFLFKPINRVIVRRQEELARVTSASERLRQEAEELRKQAETEKAELGDERNRSFAEARVDIERERDAVLAKARSEAATVVEASRHDLEDEQRSAAEGLVSTAVDIGIGVARRLLADVATERLTEAFLGRICEHLDGLSAERRTSLSKELDGRELLVATAPSLSSEERKRWLSELCTRFAGGIRARFVDDEALILGAELRFPQTTLSYCWRDSLRVAREELVRRADVS